MYKSIRWVKCMATALLLALLVPLSAPVASDSRRIVPTAAKASGERRVALIIGNAAYQDSSARLKNPVNDARSMEAILQKSGFEVITRTNTDRRTLYAAVKEFGQRLKKSDVGLFYYAGHGVQIDSANYLLPVDLKLGELNDGDDLKRDAYPLAELLDRMREANTRNIVILDACRDNPFSAKGGRSSSRGLAKISTPPETAILYATDFGNTAADGAGSDNGIFTRNLVQAIGKGFELVDLMRQVQAGVRKDTGGKQNPIFDGLLSVSFYFNAPVSVQAAPASNHAGDAEKEAWGIIKESNDPADFRSFLKEFPNGSFAGTARLKLGQLEKKQSASTAAARAEQERLSRERQEAEQKAREAEQRAAVAERRAAEAARVTQTPVPASDNASLLYTDPQTGLVWPRDGGNIAGKEMSWHEAMKWAKNLNYAGHSDWRLPTLEELKNMAGRGKDDKWLDANGFHDVAFRYYWSSSSYAGTTKYAWYVNVSGGYVYYGSKSRSNHVWPVRSGQ